MKKWNLKEPEVLACRPDTRRRLKSNRMVSKFSFIVLLAVFLSSCSPSPATQDPAATPTAVIAGEAAAQSQHYGRIRAAAQADDRAVPVRPPNARCGAGLRLASAPLSHPLGGLSYDHFYFARPIAADNVNWPLADYRYGGTFFAPDIVHTGVDIDAVEGQEWHTIGWGS